MAGEIDAGSAIKRGAVDLLNPLAPLSNVLS